MSLLLAATTLNNYTLIMAVGSFILSGQNSGVLVGRIVQPVAGAYAISGQNAIPSRTRVLQNATGAYSLGGQAVIASAARTLPSSRGAFSVSGQSAIVAYGHLVAAQTASFALSGQAIQLIGQPKTLAIGAGNYALSGQDAQMRKSSICIIGRGRYLVVFQSDASTGRYLALLGVG